MPGDRGHGNVVVMYFFQKAENHLILVLLPPGMKPQLRAPRAIWGLQWENFHRVSPHELSVPQHAHVEFLDELSWIQAVNQEDELMPSEVEDSPGLPLSGVMAQSEAKAKLAAMLVGVTTSIGA